MLYSSYRAPTVVPTEPSQPHLDRIDAYPPSSSSISASADRFEYKGHVLVASQLESHLAAHPLVRDCAVIGIRQPAGVVATTAAANGVVASTVPVAFVALSASGRERSSLGGDKESRRMKAELTKSLIDTAPALKLMKPKLLFLESIPRSPTGSLLRHLLVDKATMPPHPAPDKGFFNTVLSEPSPASSAPKKGVRDSKRRATHSQIERRRREKINDRLITLRCIVPACARQLADRRRQKQEEEDEAARIAAGGTPKTVIDAATGKPKRKRNRKRAEAKKTAEDELGLHKLDVLTHAIDYIFELQAHIEELKTGIRPEHVPTAENPFGVRDPHASHSQDAKPQHSQLEHPEDDEEEDEEEEEEEMEEDASDDEPLSKRRMSCFLSHRSSSSGASTDVSPSFSLVHPSPSAISPATTTTSPMMSLAASSPILLPDAALPLPKRAPRRESSSALFKHLTLASPRNAMGPSYGEQSEVRSAAEAPGLADARDAAELLLNFSTSPEFRAPKSRLASPPLLALDAQSDDKMDSKA